MTSGKRRRQPGVQGQARTGRPRRAPSHGYPSTGASMRRPTWECFCPSVLFWRWGSMASALKLCPESTCENAISGPLKPAVSSGIRGPSAWIAAEAAPGGPFWGPRGESKRRVCVFPPKGQRDAYDRGCHWLMGFAQPESSGTAATAAPGARGRLEPSLSQPL